MDIALFINNKDDYCGKDIYEYFRVWGSKDNGLQNIYSQIKKTLPSSTTISHLYFGSEFCEYNLPSVEDIQMIIELCLNDSLIPVFVTPPCTDYGISLIQESLSCILSYIKSFEVVINDLGVLEYIHSNYSEITLTIGRIFDKTSHDSRILSKDINSYYGIDGLKFAQNPGVLSSSYMNVFSRYNISRVEFDFPKVGLKLPDSEKHYSLYWPYQYLTTGRTCMLRALQHEGRNKFLVGNSRCSSLCKIVRAELRKPVNGFIIENGKKIDNTFLFQNGNTLFYINESEDIFMGNTNFDRLIIQI